MSYSVPTSSPTSPHRDQVPPLLRCRPVGDNLGMTSESWRGESGGDGDGGSSVRHKEMKVRSEEQH